MKLKKHFDSGSAIVATQSGGDEEAVAIQHEGSEAGDYIDKSSDFGREEETYNEGKKSLNFKVTHAH
uniref:Uncharacterized protein n=1 Tax=Panagrolaimus sp. ES5 TaxID=591445 RepID=A0AC34FV46_9BILA